MPQVYRPSRLPSAAAFVAALALAGPAATTAAQAPPADAAAVRGVVTDAEARPLDYANVVLRAAADSVVVKVEATGLDGAFAIAGLPPGDYFATVSYVGLPDLDVPAFPLVAGERLDLGTLAAAPAAAELAEATVTATRRIVEVKPDRTVFNVEGTINSAGGDGMSLLRKAPGVVVDNEDNIIVMGRAGVLVYVDGKRSPLAGEALVAFLRGLPAEQIDRIDIITNPGAKYEAEGNAGIIDIRLKKNEDFGSNGSVSATASQGKERRSNLSATVNHREGKWNTFATGGVYEGTNPNRTFFDTEQNGISVDENVNSVWEWRGGNLKLGTDYRAGDRHTFGVLVNGNYNDNGGLSTSRVAFSPLARREAVDSVLVSRTFDDNERLNVSGNVNYRYDDAAGTTLNLDLDYGTFRNESFTDQPNQFFGPGGEERSVLNLAFDTPSDIDIYTATADYEMPLAGGKLGAGAKFTKVVSDNTFDAFLVADDSESRTWNPANSNVFVYDEEVTAGYVTFHRGFGGEGPGGQGSALTFTSGLRVEHTSARGDLTRFDPERDTAAVDRDYVNLFPNVGITWNAAEKHAFSLSYGRRINRPDYNNLNPFLSFLSLVSFEQGNPTLQPEIVNTVELSHTFAYRYVTKLSYSRTEDQITRLIFRDETDERAGFITWENLASQDVVSLNVSVPAQATPWWEVYVTATGSWLNNQATYPDSAVVDVQAFNTNLFAQNTFSLPADVKLEVSGFFSGPGLWGGTFETQAMGALNFGLQRKFLADKLKVRLAADDVFFTQPWRATSEFDGISTRGGGDWDSRRVSVSLTYNFGNDKVKVRQRKTGLDDAAGRVGGGNG